MSKNIFIAASAQHVGKTTSTLGLVAALRSKGINRLGYCKPVGQEVRHIENQLVDKDAFLFSRIMDFELSREIHSPVTLPSGITAKFLDDPSAFTYEENIIKAAKLLDEQYDVVVYEGTGHPGVGAVVGLSNAKVAKMVDAQVVMLVEGGIGNTIDRLALCLPIFQMEKVPIIGVIVNKVLPDKMEKVGYYLKKKLDEMGVPLLGLIPYDKTMSDPIMSTIRRAINGRFILNEHRSRRRVEAIIPGSLIEEMDALKEKQNLLLVVSYKLADEALKKIEWMSQGGDSTESPLAGVILTGEERLEQPPNNYDLHTSYLTKHQIPVISTSLDTLGAYTKINDIEVKINVATPWKVEMANQLIREHVDLDYILDRITD